MPVRIYDISKKLGLENKEVLAKAKELGIAAARVASSSLDKITAEYLEQQLIQAHPERAAAAAAPAIPAPAPTVPSNEPVAIISAHAEDTATTEIQEAGSVTATSAAVLEAQPTTTEVPKNLPPATETVIPESPPSVPEPEPVAKAPVAHVPPAEPSPPPAAPAGPRVGDKIGFINLPP